MNEPPTPTSNRRAIILGFVVLILLMLFIISRQDRAPDKPSLATSSPTTAPPTTAPPTTAPPTTAKKPADSPKEALRAAAQLPPNASPDRPTPERLPLEKIAHASLPADAPAPLKTLKTIADDPTKQEGRLFQCFNTAPSLPERRQRSSTGRKEAGPSGESWAPWRLTLYCDESSTPLRIRVLFETKTLSALPSIGRQTTVLLQLLGRDAEHQLSARFLRVLAHPRRISSALPLEPDLFEALIAPLPPALDLRCRSTAAPELLSMSELGTASRALLSPRSQMALRVRCRDRRGPALPVLLGLPNNRNDLAELALRIGDGTELKIALHNRADGELVGTLKELLTGGLPALAGDLRAILLRPDRHRGEHIHCTSMGSPEPLALENKESKVRGRGKPVAKRKAWLICRQRGAPPVHLNLFFRPKAETALLSIGRGTRVEVQVLGAAAGQLLGLFESVSDRAIPAAARTRDLRRLGLLSERLRGSTFRCVLLRDPPLLSPPAAAYQDKTAEEAAEEAASDQAHRDANQKKASITAQRTLIHCKNAPRPEAGQRVLLESDLKQISKIERLRTGDTLQLRLSTFAHNTPVAQLIKILEVDREAPERSSP